MAADQTRQMVMVAFLQAQNCSNYPASWRHAESRDDFLRPEYFQRIARENLETMMAFEADRMTGLVLRDDNVRPELKVVKLNTDENIQTASEYQIMAIPTLLLFRNGQVAKRIQGAMPKKRLEAEIEPALAG